MLSLPRNPRDAFRLSLPQRVLYDGAVALARASGVWRYPAAREGDLERMRLIDKIYWLYKAQHPIERARRGSGLERYFAAEAERTWSLPADFEVIDEITISAVGDLITHPHLGRSGGYLYKEVADTVFSADVAMANLECGLRFDVDAPDVTFTTESGPTLAFDRAAWHAVRGPDDRRYDVVATANNHSLDLGASGLDATLDALDADGIAHHGANRADADPSRATIVERGAIRLAVLSWTFGLNGKQPPPSRPHIVNRAALNAAPHEVDFAGIDAQLHDARERGCDFVLAQLHWGMEHEHYPTPEQLAVAHALAERGVDAIIGHHPHVVQPFEAYRPQRDRDRRVPIYYSLGNLTNPFSAPYLCRGGVARLRLVQGRRADGPRETHVAEASLERVEQVCCPRRDRIMLRPLSLDER